MSNWTYITGTMRIGKSVWTEDGERLPYPDEQFRLTTAHAIPRYDEATLEYETKIDALPVIERLVKKNISILPSGEFDEISYSLSTSDHDYDLSLGEFYSEEMKNLFKKKLMEAGYSRWEADAIEAYSIQVNSYANLTIIDDVRHCSSDEMLEKMHRFIVKLLREASFHNCLFSWHDCDNPNIEYSVRSLYRCGIIEYAITKAGKTLCKASLGVVYVDNEKESKLERVLSMRTNEKWKARFGDLFEKIIEEEQGDKD